MSPLPVWLNKYIGIPYVDKGRDFSGVDCYGLIYLIYRTEFNIPLPHYLDAYPSANDKWAASKAVSKGLTEGWEKVKIPQFGDMLILNILGRPWHCGMMISLTRFIHAPIHHLVSMERLNNPIWTQRINGFYRYKDFKQGNSNQD